MPEFRKSLPLIAGCLAALAASALAEPVIDPDGPFALGEAMPARPASCDSIGQWIGRAPDYEGRISMAITGVLTQSEWDGALAYLIMCPPGGVQVMCITYEPMPPDPDQPVMFAGGYVPAGDGRIILDPCLASKPEVSGDAG